MAKSPLAQMTMRGKWAAGIEPRHFSWIVKDGLAICERPGGFGSHHRRVRRMEEIIWIRQQKFDYVISLIDAPHNLHNYEEQAVSYLHRPVPIGDGTAELLDSMFCELHMLLDNQRKVLMHHEELGDKICGYVAGYFVWSGLLDAAPKAISVIEQMTERQLGPVGRGIVAMAADLESV